MPRPRNRRDCRDGSRPCPWVGCRYHLAIEVTHAGTIRAAGLPSALAKFGARRAGDLSERVADHVTTMADTCALDVAERGGHSLREVGEFLGDMTRERVRQIEVTALVRIRRQKGWT